MSVINIPLSRMERHTIIRALQDAARKADKVARAQLKINPQSDVAPRYRAHAVECRRLCQHINFPGTVDREVQS